ncbi:MAG: RNA polymerase sigma factor [Pseudomonadota bacterium]
MTGLPPVRGLDQPGLEALYLRLEKPIYNVVYRWLWDAEDAHETVQDAFVRLWRMRDEVRLETVEPLVFRIAVRLAGRKLRWRRTWRFLAWERDEGALPADGEGADEVLAAAARERAVRAAALALPEKLRAVVMLCELSGMSYAQVAESLGIPEGTVASRRHAALAALRRSLGPRHEQEVL